MFNFQVYTEVITQDDEWIKRFHGIGKMVDVRVKFVGEIAKYYRKAA